MSGSNKGRAGAPLFSGKGKRKGGRERGPQMFSLFKPNVLVLGQHLDDMAESFLMNAFQNGKGREGKGREGMGREGKGTKWQNPSL